MQLGEAHGAWLGVVRTNQHWGHRGAQWVGWSLQAMWSQKASMSPSCDGCLTRVLSLTLNAMGASTTGSGWSWLGLIGLVSPRGVGEVTLMSRGIDNGWDLAWWMNHDNHVLNTVSLVAPLLSLSGHLVSIRISHCLIFHHIPLPLSEMIGNAGSGQPFDVQMW